MNQPQSITSLPESPDEERNRRMARYAITMGIRVICVILCFFVHGWWLLLPITGAILLPYVAVVAANQVQKQGMTVLRPGAIVLVNRRETTGADE